MLLALPLWFSKSSFFSESWMQKLKFLFSAVSLTGLKIWLLGHAVRTLKTLNAKACLLTKTKLRI